MIADSRDFPYFNGQPVEISGRSWLVILAAVVVAFLQLIALPLTATPWNFIPAVIFTGLPLVALLWAGGRLGDLFRPLTLMQVLVALGFWLLTIACSAAVALLLMGRMEAASNPVVGAFAGVRGIDLILMLMRTGIQLVGEEVVSILPFLAVLWLCVRKLGQSRTVGIVIAVIVSTAWFAAMHLPTYNWNVVQCFATIGTARLALTLAYLLTRNLWVSSIAHVTNDWALFLFAALVPHTGT